VLLGSVGQWRGRLRTVFNVLLVACVAMSGGCSLIRGALVNGVVPASSMSLAISNGTSIPVVVVVNGTSVETLAPGSDKIPASRLPALPWAVQIQTVAGRRLVGLMVREGDVQEAHASDGTGSSRGDAARVDLSCGRIDVWSGPPLSGPAPGPGIPGDCDP
jgi:hypothetical protein